MMDRSMADGRMGRKMDEGMTGFQKDLGAERVQTLSRSPDI